VTTLQEFRRNVRLAQQKAATVGPRHVCVTLPSGKVSEHTGLVHCSHAVIEEIPNGGHRNNVTAPHKYSVYWFPNHSLALRRRNELLSKPRRAPRNCWVEKTRPVL
jgi:hypothetical protein